MTKVVFSFFVHIDFFNFFYFYLGGGGTIPLVMGTLINFTLFIIMGVSTIQVFSSTQSISC